MQILRLKFITNDCKFKVDANGNIKIRDMRTTAAKQYHAFCKYTKKNYNYKCCWSEAKSETECILALQLR